ncbi:formyltransferase family protein [Marinobacter adhaerens]|uniref:formyltransferase family protein n=1 Tax=Marinobacter adhaerens TaxID=1033846 RepID=UPI003BAA6D02
MKITILCTDADHPVNDRLRQWISTVEHRYAVELVRSRAELSGGDFLFLVSCSEIIRKEHREKYRHTLVLHASDLPRGRGWSPHVWEIINGADSITLSLLEAEDQVDTGRIWLKRNIPIDKTALWYEVNQRLFAAEVEMIAEAVENHERITPYVQRHDVEPSYYPKRTPTDSKLNPCQSIEDQFDLMRMCDPDRYPAWFEIDGQKYKLILEKVDND